MKRKELFQSIWISTYSSHYNSTHHAGDSIIMADKAVEDLNTIMKIDKNMREESFWDMLDECDEE